MLQTEARKQEDRAVIDRIREAHTAALIDGNVEAWVNLFTPDAVQMPPNMPAIAGRQSIRVWSHRFMERFRAEFSLSVEEVRIAGDWAFERGAYRLVLHPRGGGNVRDDNGKYIIIYERQPDGAWGIARDIWNSDNPVPE